MTDFITPRDLSNELRVPQKKIRDYLRREYGLLADRSETRWQLDRNQASKIREHFRRQPERWSITTETLAGREHH